MNAQTEASAPLSVQPKKMFAHRMAMAIDACSKSQIKVTMHHG